MLHRTTTITVCDNFGVRETPATKVFRVNEKNAEDVERILKINEIPYHGYRSCKDGYAVELAERIMGGAVDAEPISSPVKLVRGYEVAITNRDEVASEVIRPMLDEIEQEYDAAYKMNTLDYIGKNFTVEEATFLNATCAATREINARVDSKSLSGHDDEAVSYTRA